MNTTEQPQANRAKLRELRKTFATFLRTKRGKALRVDKREAHELAEWIPHWIKDNEHMTNKSWFYAVGCWRSLRSRDKKADEKADEKRQLFERLCPRTDLLAYLSCGRSQERHERKDKARVLSAVRNALQKIAKKPAQAKTRAQATLAWLELDEKAPGRYAPLATMHSPLRLNNETVSPAT